jgi:hypothetical protein
MSDKGEKKTKSRLPSWDDVKSGVIDFFWESDRTDESDDLPYRGSARLVKLILPVYIVQKLWISGFFV